MTLARSLDPLADYLEPQFGDVYDKYYWLMQKEWPADLREAVRHYLVDEADDNLYRQALALLTGRGFEEVRANDRVQEAEGVFAKNDPWNVIYTFHKAAVIFRPALESLITSRDSWEDDNDLDVATWLEAHATDAQLRDMILRLPAFQPPAWHFGDPDLLADDLVEVLTPGKLLELWTQVNGPAPSDLTDTEWQLVLPFMPQSKRVWLDDDLEALHRPSVNGFLYRCATGVGWWRMPDRYCGKNYRTLRTKYYLWSKDGVFVRMLDALDGNLEAARLVAWLRTIVDAAPPVSLQSRKDTGSPSPSDLTDTEWGLLVPLLPHPNGKGDGDLEALDRPKLNAFLYRDANGVPWSRIPVKYYGDGDYGSITSAFYGWRKAGVFTRMLDALDGNPKAVRLVAWLRTTAD